MNSYKPWFYCAFGSETVRARKHRKRLCHRGRGRLVQQSSIPAYPRSCSGHRQSNFWFGAGYKTIPAPPTFPMALDMEGPDFLPVLKLLGLDSGRTLHASQEFEYSGTIYAGDTITVTSKLKEIFDKKGGALEFVVMENSYINKKGELVAVAANTLVYRNP